MLFSYTKSLMAGGIALLAVIFAVLWFQNRTVVLNELIQNSNNLKTKITAGQVYSAVIADYAKRLAALRADTKKITDKFVGQDYESPLLVRAIVAAASQSGMEMTDTSKHDKKTKILATQGKGLTIEVLSYAVTLKGSYLALVKFLQNLAAWNISHKIDSLEVTPAEDGKPPETHDTAKDEIEVSLVLSVFLLDQPKETKSYSP